MQIVGQIWLNLVTWTCGSWNEGQHDLYFTVQWFCLVHCVLKTIRCIYIILSEYESVWPDVWPQNNVGHSDLYFMVQWLCLIPWTLFHVRTWLFGIMNHYDPTLDLKINVGHHDIYFIVQWFHVIAWRLFDVWTSSLGIMDQYDWTFGIMGQYDWTFDLKINVCHCDLYFMVQWFCLISQRLFDGWTSYF